jgi:predicted ester cyclase
MTWKLFGIASAVLVTSSLVVSAYTPQQSGHREEVIKFVDEVWTKGNVAYVDVAMDPQIVRFGHTTEGNTTGIPAYKDRVQKIRSEFSDYNVTLVDMMGVGDKAIFTWRLKGNYVGPNKSITPGRAVDITGKTVWIMRGGKVVEEIVEMDPEEYYRQIQMAVPYSEVENRALVLSYLYEVMSRGNVSALDELVAANHILHDINDQTIKGIEPLRAHILDLRKAFPDLTVTINDIRADGNLVTARWTIAGTQKGEWNGYPPTNLHFTAIGLSQAFIKDGKIQETWSNWDTMKLRMKAPA